MIPIWPTSSRWSFLFRGARTLQCSKL